MKKKTQKNKSIKLNYIYNVSYQILTLITPLITAPYLSRVLKADGIGAYSYTYSLVSVSYTHLQLSRVVIYDTASLRVQM